MNHFSLIKLNCWSCNASLPDSAQFCPKCGAKQHDTHVKNENQLKYNLNQSFKQYLSDFLTQTFGFQRTKKLLKLYAQSDVFQKLLEGQIDVLTKEISSAPFHRHQYLMNRNFFPLVHNFVVVYGQQVLDFKLSDSILGYLWQRREEVDVLRMALDFLNFAYETDYTLHTDLQAMPPKHIKNAVNHFLFTDSGETILLICDVYLMRNFKNGFALTDRGIYWKEPMSKAFALSYDRIGALELTENWLNINGLFFNARMSLNIKLLLFLRVLVYLINREN